MTCLRLCERKALAQPQKRAYSWRGYVAPNLPMRKVKLAVSETY